MYHVSVSYPHLSLAGTQIKVEAALKPLVDEATVGRNLAQTGELPGKKRVLPVLWILLVPQSSLGGQYVMKGTFFTTKMDCTNLCSFVLNLN